MTEEKSVYDSLPEDVIRLTPQNLKYLKAKSKYAVGGYSVNDLANMAIDEARKETDKLLDDVLKHPEKYTKEISNSSDK